MTRRTSALAACAMVAVASCGNGVGSAATGSPAGAGPTTAPTRTGGETAWITSTAVSGDAAVSLGALSDGRVVAAIARQQGMAAPATVLRALDPSGALAWSRTFGGACRVDLTPLGSTTSGAVAVLVTGGCPGPVSGLGADVVGPGGSVALLDGAGQFTSLLPTPGDVMQATVDDAGDVLVLASSSGAVSAASIAGDGTQRWRHAIDAGRQLAAAPDQGAVVAVASTPAQLVRLGQDGSSLWTRSLPDGFAVRALAVLTDGAVAVLGLGSQALTWGRGAAGANDDAVLVVEPDGAPRVAARIDDAPPGAPAVLAALPHGRVLVAGFAGCDRLRAFSPQLDLVWERPLDTTCAASASAATATRAGQIVIAGQFVARAEFGEGFVIEPAGPRDAFVAGLWP